MSIQIWKNYADSWQIVLLHPDGSQIAFGDEQMGTARYLVGGTELLVYYGMPAPYLLQQEIFIELIPNGSNVFVDSGLWSIRLYPVRIVDGRFSMWMSDARTRNMQTRFLRPTPDATLTIPFLPLPGRSQLARMMHARILTHHFQAGGGRMSHIQCTRIS